MAVNAAPWHLYLVRCRDGSLYTGIATDVERRLTQHADDPRRGAKYLRGRGPLKLVFSAAVGDRARATRMETRVKKLSREQKERLLTQEDYFRSLLDAC